MRIAMFVDWVGAIRTEDEEYLEIRQFVEAAIGTDHKFETKVAPHKLLNHDVYVIDFGGLSAMGSRDSYSVLVHELIRQVEDRPNTLFVIWSNFTFKAYREEMLERLGLAEPGMQDIRPDGTMPAVSLDHPCNVVVKSTEDFIDSIEGGVFEETTNLVRLLREWNTRV